MFSFSLQNLRRNPKDTAFFACSILITSAIITVFFCIINNPYFGNTGAAIPSGYDISFIQDVNNSYAMSQDALINAFDRGIGNGIFTIMLSVLMLAICIMTIFFSHNFYLTGKTKDIGIMMMNGCSVVRIVKFLIIQNFIVVVVTAPIGCLLGVLVNPLLNALIYAQMGQDAPIWVFSFSSFGYAIGTMMMICVWLVLLDFGFIYRCESMDVLLKTRTKMQSRRAKNLIKRIVYTIIYCFSVYFILYYPVKFVNMIFMVYIGVLIYFGAVNVFRYVVPEVLGWVQRRFYSADKRRLLSLANLQYSVASSSQLVTLVLLSTTILFYYLCKFQNDPATWTVVMFTYVVILLLVTVCIIYKLSYDALSKEPIYNRMLCIGYLKEDIKAVIRQEVYGFFLLVLLVAFPQMFAILFAYFLAGEISVLFVVFLIGVFAGAMILGAVLMNAMYLKLILHVDVRNRLVQE